MKRIQVRWEAGLLGLIGIEIGLAIAYVTSVWLHGEAYPAFDFDSKGSIPSILQALQLLLLGAIPLSLLLLQPHTTRPPSRRLLGIAALFFLYAGLDEILKFHLMMDHHLWRLIYLAIGLATPVIFYRDFLRLWQFHRRAITWVAIGISIFIVGGFGTEILKTYVLQPCLNPLYPDNSVIPTIVETVRVALEELSELVGESLTLYGVCLLATKRIRP